MNFGRFALVFLLLSITFSQLSFSQELACPANRWYCPFFCSCSGGGQDPSCWLFDSQCKTCTCLPEETGGGPACGNGIPESGEECGEPGLTCGTGQTCDTEACQCSQANHICGNGIIEQTEQCEQQTDCSIGSYCNSGCQCVQDNSICGDGAISGREACDPASPELTCGTGQFCDSLECQCITQTCGNGIKEGTEQCEVGIACTGTGDACDLQACTCAVPQAQCGNGQAEGNEQCDGSDNSNCGGYACTQSCTCLNTCTSSPDCAQGLRCSGGACTPDFGSYAIDRGYCGDGFLKTGEECDINTNNCAPGYTCSQECTCDPVVPLDLYASLPSCGNGQIDAGEQCESEDGCQAGQSCLSCQCTDLLQAEVFVPPYCGNGVVEGSEQCEYANQCQEGYSCEGCGCREPGRLYGMGAQDALSPIILIGLFAAVAIAALAYMAGNFTQSQPLLIWAKAEFREIFTSAFIIVFVLVAIGSLDAFISATTDSQDLTGAALNHADYFIQNSASTIGYFTEATFYISKRASFSYSISTMQVPFFSNKYLSRSPSSGLSALMSPIYQAIDNLSKIIYAFSIEKMLLRFFSSTIPTLLLPIAFALRTFPLTRRIGTTLIAVCLGAYLWFPASIVFASQAYPRENLDLNAIKPVSSFDPGAPPSKNLVCSPVFAAFALPGEEFYEWAICGALNLIPGFGQAAFAACKWVVFLSYLTAVQGFPLGFEPALRNYAEISTAELINNYYAPLEAMLPLISSFYISALISLLLTIFITVIMTKGTSEVLGGETRILGISRLV